jgi:ADP-ribose pyrophosphatase YjhB (NUDIX family)
VTEDLPQVTRLAAYGLIRRQSRVLLCRVAPGNIGSGHWMLPGGGLDFGEDPEIGTLREVEEETGLIGRIAGPVRVFSSTGVWERSTGPVRFHHVQFVYPVDVVGGTERVEVDGSTDGFGWFSPDEITQLERIEIVDDALALADARS